VNAATAINGVDRATRGSPHPLGAHRCGCRRFALESERFGSLNRRISSRSRLPHCDRSVSRGRPHIIPGDADQAFGRGNTSSGRCGHGRAPVDSSESTVDTSSRKSDSSPFGGGLRGARVQRIVPICGLGGGQRRPIRNDVLQNSRRLMTA